MPHTRGILETFVLDDPGSRFLYTMQNGAKRPWFRVHNRIFDPRFVLHRIPGGHPVTLDNVDLRAVKVSGLI